MDFKLITVAIADYKIAKAPDILRTILGSCIGICVYDPENGVGGLAHIMLPNQTAEAVNLKKYAETAIPMMIEDMITEGADKKQIKAKITGGATMFKMASDSFIGAIGVNNTKRVREVLEENGIQIMAEDVGGDYGRTIDFYIKTGQVKIKSLGREEKSI
jgi:chemotaxis protein CheD